MSSWILKKMLLSLGQLCQSPENVLSYCKVHFSLWSLRFLGKLIIRKVVKILSHVGGCKRIKGYVKEMRAPNKYKDLPRSPSALAFWFLKVLLVLRLCGAAFPLSLVFWHLTLWSSQQKLRCWTLLARLCFVSSVTSTINIFIFNYIDEDIGIHQYYDKKESGKI